MTDRELAGDSWLVAMLEGALDMVCMGIVLARKSGHLMYSNESARYFLEEQSLFETVAVPGRLKGLPRLCGDLAGRVKGLGSTREIWSSRNGRLLVELIPILPTFDKHGMLGRRGGAMLMMQERGKHQYPALGHLMDLFGLTPAEARTCLMLCQVESVEGCARRLNVSPATVRSQLQVAMHKTSTSKQAELLSLILSIPGGRRDSDQEWVPARKQCPDPVLTIGEPP